MLTAKRQRANQIKPFRCKNLIVVLENPRDYRNIGTVIRNVNALGASKVYVVDQRKLLPDDWQQLRQPNNALFSASVSAIKWTFLRRFDNTADCLAHLAANKFQSLATSPYIKGKTNILLHDGDYTKFNKLAVWFGNESHGLSDAVIDSSELCINLPMLGMIESLNLGTCSGIVLYEITKQRRAYQSQYKFRDKRGIRSVLLPTEIAAPDDGHR
jgi:tRNA (guanosine-2'-O-)-methyltransferase